MPTFDCEVDVDDFMDELSEREIKEVIEWLQENEDDFDESSILPKNLNFDESLLLQNLNKIKANLIQVTLEEMEVINQIAKRL
jgi:hypothetical protein